jgi:signal transduction histidine kinase
VIENLAENAVKYGYPDTPVKIEIVQNETLTRISVHNEGRKIEKEKRDYLFELFQRGEASETKSKWGWGVGLTLVRGITEAHGGKVRVESTEEKGTTFIVELPSSVKSERAPGKAA